MKVVLVPESLADALGIVIRNRRGKRSQSDLSKGAFSAAALSRAERGQSDIKLCSLYEIFGGETTAVVREAINLWELHR